MRVLISDLAWFFLPVWFCDSVVLATYPFVRPSVCVTSRYFIKTAEWIELVLDLRASHGFFYTVL